MWTTLPYVGLWHRPRATELRIDVDRGTQPLDGELDVLFRRMQTPGDRLHGIAAVGSGDPRYVIRHREDDGEFYVYVQDVHRQRLAGSTVFNRLIEVRRDADRIVRAPHSRYAAGYQRQGLASMVYRWGLDAGLCLLTGARQSPAAHALWLALSRHYALRYVDLRSKVLTDLGDTVSPRVLDDLHTRMLLLGRGWNVARFAAATGMR